MSIENLCDIGNFKLPSCCIILYFSPTNLDINECQTGSHSCTPHQECVNNDGGYECVTIQDDQHTEVCEPGFVLNSITLLCDGKLNVKRSYGLCYMFFLSLRFYRYLLF